MAAGKRPRTVGPLLDVYHTAARLGRAYSLRKLSSTYSGKVLQIRRSSDNVEVGVAFDNDGVLSLDSAVSNIAEETTGSSAVSTSAVNLGEFVAAGGTYTDADTLGSADSALVVKWMDQSGNAINATQTTAGSQPRVVLDGAIVMVNGKPAMDTKTSGVQELTFDSDIVTPVMITAVSEDDANPTGSGWNYLIGQAYDGAVRTEDQTWRLAASSNDFDHGGDLYVNGVQITVHHSPPSSASQNLLHMNSKSGGNLTFRHIFGTYSARHWHGTAQEIIIWSSTDEFDVHGALAEINTFYSIY